VLSNPNFSWSLPDAFWALLLWNKANSTELQLYLHLGGIQSNRPGIRIYPTLRMFPVQVLSTLLVHRTCRPYPLILHSISKSSRVKAVSNTLFGYLRSIFWYKTGWSLPFLSPADFRSVFWYKTGWNLLFLCPTDFPAPFAWLFTLCYAKSRNTNCVRSLRGYLRIDCGVLWSSIYFQTPRWDGQEGQGRGELEWRTQVSLTSKNAESYILEI